MESSMGVGFMAVFAVTGSVVILAHQIHKRLLSGFMKEIEFQLGGATTFGIGTGGSAKRKSGTTKKTVRFAEDVMEPSNNNKEYRKKHLFQKQEMEGGNIMPLNREALYRGIIAYKSLKGHQYA